MKPRVPTTSAWLARAAARSPAFRAVGDRTNTVRPALVDKRSFYWTELGFEGPAPDGTVHIGLFAGSWGPFGGGYGRMLLDPWTGQVLGFAT
jgi:hypothetical protein